MVSIRGVASDASASTAAFVVIQGIGPVSTDDRSRCRRVASAAGQGALTGIDVSHTDRARWPSRLPHRPRLRRYPRAVTVIAAASLAPVIVMVLGLGGAIIGGKGDGVDQGRASDASASTAAFVVIQGIGPVSTDDRLRCRRVASAAGQGALTGIDVSHTDRARWPSRLPHRPRLRRYPRAVTVIAAASLAPVIVMVLGLGGAIIGGKGDGVDQGRRQRCQCIDGSVCCDPGYRSSFHRRPLTVP